MTDAEYQQMKKQFEEEYKKNLEALDRVYRASTLFGDTGGRLYAIDGIGKDRADEKLCATVNGIARSGFRLALARSRVARHKFEMLVRDIEHRLLGRIKHRLAERRVLARKRQQERHLDLDVRRKHRRRREWRQRPNHASAGAAGRRRHKDRGLRRGL